MATKNHRSALRFARLIDRTRKLGSAEFMDYISKRHLTRALKALIGAQFDGKFDPYGEKWAPRRPPREFHGRFRPARGSLMQVTKKLRGGFVITATKGGVRVFNPTTYAMYHQSDGPRKVRKDGQPILPRRMMVPDSKMGVPIAWAQMLNNAMTKGTRDFLGMPRKRS